MAVRSSSLSIACSAVAQFLRDQFDAIGDDVVVIMGAPADAAGSTDEQRLNLFFYRFEPAGIGPVARPGEPWRVRLHCLMTAFGVTEADLVSPGENELRILGEVMRLFHEHPIIPDPDPATATSAERFIDVDGEPVRLQALFSPLDDQQVNQIWSTQGDTTYRPSLAYEFALTPVVPEVSTHVPPRVGAIGTQTRATFDARHAPFTGQASAPPMSPVRIDIANPAWVPALSFVHERQCVCTLAFDVDDVAFAAFVPEVWLAGDPSDTVQLVWERWSPSGWTQVGAPINVNPFNTAIDPDAIPVSIPGVFPFALTLPIVLAPDESAGQALLYATRDGGASRSNPLLLSLYRSV